MSSCFGMITQFPQLYEYIPSSFRKKNDNGINNGSSRTSDSTENINNTNDDDQYASTNSDTTENINNTNDDDQYTSNDTKNDTCVEQPDEEYENEQLKLSYTSDSTDNVNNTNDDDQNTSNDTKNDTCEDRPDEEYEYAQLQVLYDIWDQREQNTYFSWYPEMDWAQHNAKIRREFHACLNDFRVRVEERGCIYDLLHLFYIPLPAEVISDHIKYRNLYLKLKLYQYVENAESMDIHVSENNPFCVMRKRIGVIEKDEKMLDGNREMFISWDPYYVIKLRPKYKKHFLKLVDIVADSEKNGDCRK